VYKYTEKIVDGSNGDVAVNSYHMYEVSTARLPGFLGWLNQAGKICMYP